MARIQALKDEILAKMAEMADNDGGQALADALHAAMRRRPGETDEEDWARIADFKRRLPGETDEEYTARMTFYCARQEDEDLGEYGKRMLGFYPREEAEAAWRCISSNVDCWRGRPSPTRR